MQILEMSQNGDDKRWFIKLEIASFPVSALQPKRDIIGVRVSSRSSLVEEISFVDQQHLDLITRLTKLDNDIRTKKFEAINSKKAAKRLVEALRTGSDNIEQCEEDMQLMSKTELSSATQLDLLSMIEWANTIPEFLDFPLEDRLIIIKRFSSQYITLENGFFTARQNKRDESNIYQICTGGYMPREVWMIKDKVRH